MTDTPLEKFLARVRHRPSGEGYMAHCPTARHPNGDRHPSLKVDEGADKQLLLSCHSQKCAAKEIMTAVGLTERDMFMEKPTNGHHRKPPKTYPTAEDAANALQHAMLKRGEITGPRTRFDKYADATGKVVGVVLRFPTPPDEKGKPGKTFRQISPVEGGWAIKGPATKWPLFRLRLLNLDRPVVVVEGEKCVDAAVRIGLNATTSQGGANGTAKTDWSALAGREVWLLTDIGDPGETWTRSIVRILQAIGCTVKVVRLPGLHEEGDDIVEFIELRREDGKDDESIRQEIEALAKQALPVSPDETQSSDEAQDDEEDQDGFVWAPITATEFDAVDYTPVWRTDKIVVDRQPLVIGAPLKTLKTTFMLDLAISQATGTLFLNEFLCPMAGRVAILSGESGAHTIQETARRICASKGIKHSELGDNLRYLFTLPQLANVSHLAAFRRGIERDKIDVVYVDPLYLSLLSGSSDVRAENMYQTGPLLLNVARACLDAGATPGLVHHTKKGAGREGEPIDLADLAFSGIAEFARQWILLSRRQKFDPATGKHLLWLSVGGSVGHGSLHAVDIDEGFLQSDFSGRKWDVRVTSPMESINAEHEQKAQKKNMVQLQRERAEDSRLLQAIDHLSTGGRIAGYTEARKFAGLSSKAVTQAVDRLTDEGIIEVVPIDIPMGKGATRTCKGLRRKPLSRDDEAMFGDGTNGY